MTKCRAKFKKRCKISKNNYKNNKAASQRARFMNKQQVRSLKNRKISKKGSKK